MEIKKRKPKGDEWQDYILLEKLYAWDEFFNEYTPNKIFYSYGVESYDILSSYSGAAGETFFWLNGEELPFAFNSDPVGKNDNGEWVCQYKVHKDFKKLQSED